MSETETRTHITQVGTVGVPVTDQDRALEFYLEKLGFEKRIDTPYGEGRALGRGGAAGRGDDDRARSLA